MFDAVLALLTGSFNANLRRFARMAAFAAVAIVFAVIALAAGAAALFLALDAALGGIRASLVVAAAAAVIALIASIPLWRKPKPPPSSQLATLVELAVAIGLALLTERKRPL
jgi:membrane protein DedA with SNARE-associated domain